MLTMLFLINSLSCPEYNQLDRSFYSVLLCLTLKNSQMWKSSICSLQFIRLQNLLLQKAFMEEALTETEVVKLPNTPTGHGQKKEVYSTLNPLIILS